MKAHRRLWTLLGIIVALVIALVFGAGYCMWTRQLPGPLLSLLLRRVQLPPGFTIQLYAAHVPNARSMTLGSRGTVFVGSRRARKIYALLDHHGDGKADEVITVATDLTLPNGVAFHDGALYVADVNRVLRFDDIELRLKSAPAPLVVNSQLPSDIHHGSRIVRFGPDGWLYISVGAPCNICEPKDEHEAAILRMRPDGSDLEVFARGVRNSVGFDWQPQSQQLWFTDNGRDGMGDNIPPDKLNFAPRSGMNFGFPYCHGGSIPDPEFGRMHACSEFVAPAVNLPAHVAALGMTFYTGNTFPVTYQNQIFIAEHGSWDRSVPTGDRISVVELRGDGTGSYEPFAIGWQVGRLRWGRPVDILAMPDGSLLVSDDYAGAIYRIVYHTP
jgi:glucose/arabinose dehydrogenase